MTPAPAAVLAALLTRWQHHFDAARPDDLARLFTEDALFQGFAPAPLLGRDAVRTYYEHVPPGTRASATVLHAYATGDDLIGGIADVLFTPPTGPDRPARLSVLARHTGDRWRIRHYHVSG
ncbi:SgcJ/EcaC family oxidoreductase [Streptomyces sp. NPDC049837]|uniref:SgcJ/EcaC family oxidoreductase n=1 Tax=Streptomyces sp. NPDC049837 TaxID=3155277 RepID=UPI003435F1B2